MRQIFLGSNIVALLSKSLGLLIKVGQVSMRLPSAQTVLSAQQTRIPRTHESVEMLAALTIVLLITSVASPRAVAGTLTTLYSFSGPDGASPQRRSDNGCDWQPLRHYQVRLRVSSGTRLATSTALVRTETLSMVEPC